MRSVSRETFRLALFFGQTPFWAALMISGSASFMAASANARSPAAIASSTLRTKPRTRERRALLMRVRRAILRVAILADLVLAILVPFGERPRSPLRADNRRENRDRKRSGRRRAFSPGAGGRQRPPGCRAAGLPGCALRARQATRRASAPS